MLSFKEFLQETDIITFGGNLTIFKNPTSSDLGKLYKETRTLGARTACSIYS